jgi:hypothetical protein
MSFLSHRIMSICSSLFHGYLWLPQWAQTSIACLGLCLVALMINRLGAIRLHNCQAGMVRKRTEGGIQQDRYTLRTRSGQFVGTAEGHPVDNGPRTYFIEVRFNKGEHLEFEVSRELFHSANYGCLVDVQYRVGCLFGNTIPIDIVGVS